MQVAIHNQCFIQNLHVSHGGWNPNLWGEKTNTKYMTESMILEGETWARGGKISWPPPPV